MSVQIVINNVVSHIDGPLPIPVVQRIRETCSYSVKGAEFSAYGQEIYCPRCRKQTKEATMTDLYAQGYPTPGIRGYRFCINHGWVKPISLWDGQQCLWDGRSNSFPTGVITRVVDVLKANAIDFTIKDNRIPPVTRELPWHGKTPRYYQQNAVRALKKRSRGILHAATGTGKTLAISWLIKNLGVNTLVLTHTRSVFHQVANALREDLQIPIGQVGDGLSDWKVVTVAMPQSLTETVRVPKRKLVKGVWKTVNTKVLQVKPAVKPMLANIEACITDEVHHISADTCQLVANSCPNAYFRVGVSATPYRDDGKDVLIEAVTGRVAYKYSATQAIEDGYLARPTIHLVKFKQQRHPVYIDKAVTDKKTGAVTIKREKAKYADVYDEVITHNNRRNDLIARIAWSQYRYNKSVLVIVRHIAHGEEIYKRLEYLGKDVRYVNGEDDPAYLQKTLYELDQKKFMICIATGIFSEGVDIRRLDCVINATAGDSSVNAMQIVGRALRKVIDPETGKDLKPAVDIFDIYDTNIRWFSQHAANREMIYSTEPGYILKEEDAAEYMK